MTAARRTGAAWRPRILTCCGALGRPLSEALGPILVTNGHRDEKWREVEEWIEWRWFSCSNRYTVRVIIHLLL